LRNYFTVEIQAAKLCRAIRKRHCGMAGGSEATVVALPEGKAMKEEFTTDGSPMRSQKGEREKNHVQPFIIGIAGGTASGKTTVCTQLMQALGGQRVALLSLDEFYRDLTAEECASVSDVNFDEPQSFDIVGLTTCLDTLSRGEAAQVPVYDFVTSRRSAMVRNVAPADVVILEGILVLHLPETLQRCHMKIFVDTDDDVRLARRIRRDTVERGRDVEAVIRQYTRFVKPSFEKYILPSRNNADVVVPWRESNHVAVDLITQHIRSKLGMHELLRIYTNLIVMPATMQTRGMHTKIRSRDTPRQEFAFFADRLIRLVVEAALGYLPFAETEVMTPVGEPYQGVEFSRRICGVSIIRSGEAMENALRTCCIGVKIGKILIDQVGKDRSLHVLYEKLPYDIAERHVLLMDPILASGNTCAAAIEVLTKLRNVKEDKIILITIIAASKGISLVCKKFPGVKVITTEIDEGIDENGTVLPGIGNFGDRYFGTCCAADEPSRLLTGNLSSVNSERASDASTSNGNGNVL